ncbi:MFS transporter [Lophium mytilinum]|uniref:MFS transporter n=1 Tax=Lophium mytilinum TaxID=390894 RepID=A0A6A6QUC2_9PEZI|nr:MFS transporter [Lophium mytilinum]
MQYHAASADSRPVTGDASSTTSKSPCGHHALKDEKIELGDFKGDAKEHDTPPSTGTRDKTPTAALDNEKPKKDDAVDTTTRTHSTDETGAVTSDGTNKATVEKGETLPGDEAVDESQYLKGLPLVVLTIGLCLCTFVIALDNTIIATAIPRITTVFNSLGDVGWYGSSYLLTTCSLMPSFGRVYTYFDVKWTYLSALLLFEIGSIICAAATSSAMFIVGRAIAGAGAAALFSGGITIVGYSVALRKRPIYIAALSSMFGIASVVGPLLGGALTDKASWRWCFWINLPFGAVTIVVVAFFFKSPERRFADMSLKQRILEIDLLGAGFLISAVVCLLLALQWGGQKYPWSDSKIWGCLLGFGLLTMVFIGIQVYRGERGTLPPRILLQRTVGIGSLFSALFSMGLYTHIFYLPFYFQACKGTTAEGSGIRTIAYLVSNTLAAIVVGGTVTKIGYYTPFMWIGSAIFCIGAGLLYTLKVNSPAGVWIGYQILAGAGSGMAVQIPFVAVQVVTSEKDMPTGNACVFFFNSLGGALAISIAQNIFVNTLAEDIPVYAPGVDPKIVIGAGATHVREVMAKYGWNNMLDGVLEAYTKGITRAFLVAVAAAVISFIVSFGMEWKSVKGRKIAPAAA